MAQHIAANKKNNIIALVKVEETGRIESVPVRIIQDVSLENQVHGKIVGFQPLAGGASRIPQYSTIPKGLQAQRTAESTVQSPRILYRSIARPIPKPTARPLSKAAACPLPATLKPISRAASKIASYRPYSAALYDSVNDLGAQRSRLTSNKAILVDRYVNEAASEIMKKIGGIKRSANKYLKPQITPVIQKSNPVAFRRPSK